MLNTIFATKIGMSQAWSKLGKRLPITKLLIEDNRVLNVKKSQDQKLTAEIAYGTKKLKNMSKPLREQLKKSGFSLGALQIKGVKVDESVKGGDLISAEALAVGDVVAIQGTSKGRGFAGGVKRHGFHGGPRTHGQSDRGRAPGSIGSGTDPGRVWKGKRMAGHMGTDTKTVTGLVIAYIAPDNKEVWVTGPVPGYNTSIVRIQKTGEKKNIELDLTASAVPEVKEEAKVVKVAPAVEAEPAAETVEKPETNQEEVKA